MEMWETGERICPRLWADQRSTSAQDCFRLSYMASLIEYALCLRNADITFGPGDISWTLGAALIEGTYLWHSTSESQKGFLSLKGNERISSSFLLFALLSFLLLIVHYSHIKLPMPSRGTFSARGCLPSYFCPKRQPA